MEILRSLVENSRITISQMSKEIEIPDATISNRLKKLEKNAIKQYTLILNPETLGLKVTAIIIIQTESEKHENVEKELSILEEVSEVYSISGEYDILIKVWAHSIHGCSSKYHCIQTFFSLAHLVKLIRCFN